MSLPDWPRPFYEPGGGDPFLFYVVFGTVDTTTALSRAVYRSAGLPEGLEMLHYTAERHPEVLAGFREGYVWNCLLEDSPEFAQRIAAATECLVVRGSPADSTTLNFLRDTVGLLTYLLDQGGIGVYDPQMLSWWPPEQWREHLFQPAESMPLEHVVILTSPEEEEGTWFHTRGLRKFGRPDLSLHSVPFEKHEAVIDLFNRLIEHQALGAVIPEGYAIRMASLPAGMTCHHRGDLDDPDFNNVHLEIRWPTS